jgi:hypothetical protein
MFRSLRYAVGFAAASMALASFTGAEPTAAREQATGAPHLTLPLRLSAWAVNNLDKNGEGAGKASVATKISFERKKNVMELENYSSEPVRLQQVTIEK